MKCKRCKNEIGDSQFCGYCGQQNDHNKQSKKILIAVGIVAILIFVTVVLVFLLMQSNRSNINNINNINNTATVQSSTTLPTVANTESEDVKYQSDSQLVQVDDDIIYVKTDGLYSKKGLDGEEKQIVNVENVESIFSNGKIVFYVKRDNDGTTGTETFGMHHEIHSVNINNGDSKVVATKDNPIQLIARHNDYLYYNVATDYDNSNLYKISVNAENNEGETQIVGGEDLSDYMGRLGDKIYFIKKGAIDQNNGDTVLSYDLNTCEFSTHLSGVTIKYHPMHQYKDKIYFYSCVYDEFYEKTDCCVYIINSDNSITKSAQIQPYMDLQIMDNGCEFALFFNDGHEDEDTMFDLYKVDLKTGEYETLEKGAGMYKYKNYFVTYDLEKPDDIYFMYNVGLYDKETNQIINKKHDEFEINITEKMWIIDGRIVDHNLKTYKIYE